MTPAEKELLLMLAQIALSRVKYGDDVNYHPAAIRATIERLENLIQEVGPRMRDLDYYAGLEHPPCTVRELLEQLDAPVGPSAALQPPPPPQSKPSPEGSGQTNTKDFL